MILSDSMLCESLQWFCVTMKFFQMLKVAADLPNTLPPTSFHFYYIYKYSQPALFVSTTFPASIEAGLCIQHQFLVKFAVL